MADPTVDFFEGLPHRGTDPVLADLTATFRFDLADNGESGTWLVSIAAGEIRVSRGAGQADCTIGAGRELFEGITNGAVNPMAAVLRGELAVSGDAGLLVRVLRLFPQSPPAPVRHAVVVERGRRG